MKKVALLISRYSYSGGLEKYARQLAAAFAAKGCRVTVLTTHSTIQSSGNIEVITLAKRSKISLYQLLHFDHLCKKWLKENPQDIVFGLERTREQDVYRAGSGVHKVYLERKKQEATFLKRTSLMMNPLHSTLCRFEKTLFENPNLQLLFTNSQMVKNEITTHFCTDPSKIQVVHNGVEYHHFETPFNERSFIPSQEHRFLFVGNGYFRKGLHLILPALAKLKEKKWTLSVVGKERNEAFFKKEAQKLGLLSKIHFLGSQQELLPLYQKADTLILPSLYDPFSNVTLEALAMGLFVVTSPFNGGSEILTPQRGTIIENIFDPSSLMESLEFAIQMPKDKESMKTRREGIKELDFTFQLDKIVQKTLTIV